MGHEDTLITKEMEHNVKCPATKTPTPWAAVKNEINRETERTLSGPTGSLNAKSECFLQDRITRENRKPLPKLRWSGFPKLNRTRRWLSQWTIREWGPGFLDGRLEAWNEPQCFSNSLTEWQKMTGLQSETPLFAWKGTEFTPSRKII